MYVIYCFVIPNVITSRKGKKDHEPRKPSNKCSQSFPLHHHIHSFQYLTYILHFYPPSTPNDKLSLLSSPIFNFLYFSCLVTITHLHIIAIMNYTSFPIHYTMSTSKFTKQRTHPFPHSMCQTELSLISTQPEPLGL